MKARIAATTLTFALLLTTLAPASAVAPAEAPALPVSPDGVPLRDLQGMITGLAGARPASMEVPHFGVAAMSPSPRAIFDALPRAGRTTMEAPLLACLTGTVRVPTDLPEVIAGDVCIQDATVILEQPAFGRRILTVPVGASLSITNSVVRNEDGDRLHYGILEAQGGLTLTGNTILQVVVDSQHTDPETVTHVISGNTFRNSPYGVFTNRDRLTVTGNTFALNTYGLFVDAPPDGVAWKAASNPEVENNTFEENEAGITVYTCTECPAALGTFVNNEVRANIVGIYGYSNGWINPDNADEVAKAEFHRNNVYDNWGDAIQGIRGLSVVVPGVGPVTVLEDSQVHYNGNYFGTDSFFLSAKDVKENDAGSPRSTSAPPLPFPIRLITSATTWSASSPPPALTGPVVVKSPGSLTVTGINLATEHAIGAHKGGRLTLDDVTVTNGNGVIIRNDADIVKNSDFTGTRLYDMVVIYRNNGTAQDNVLTGSGRDRNAAITPLAGLATDDFVFTPKVNGNTIRNMRYGIVAAVVSLTFNDNTLSELGLPQWAEFQNQDTAGVLMVLGTLNADGNTFKNMVFGVSGNIGTINSESDTFEGAYMGYQGIQLTTSKFNRALFANNQFGQWAILDTSSTVTASNYTFNGIGMWVALNSATVSTSNFYNNYLVALYPYSSTLSGTFTTSVITCNNCWAPDDEAWFSLYNSSVVWTSALSPNDTPSPSWKGKVKEVSGAGNTLSLADGSTLEAPAIARKGAELKVEGASVDLAGFSLGAKGGGQSGGATGKLTIDRAVLRNGNFVATNSTAASVKNTIFRDFGASANIVNVWNGATVECSQFDTAQARPAFTIEQVSGNAFEFRRNLLDRNKELLSGFKLGDASLGGDAIHRSRVTFEQNSMRDGTSTAGAIYVTMNGTQVMRDNNLFSNLFEEGLRRRQHNNTVVVTTPTATQATGNYYGDAGGGYITFRDHWGFVDPVPLPQILHNGPGLAFRTQSNATTTWPPPVWSPYATAPSSFDPCVGFTFTPGSPLDFQTVAFNSEASFDPSGFALSYSWNFGGEGSSTAANPTFKFADGGSKTVTLTVTTAGGKTASLSKTVSVAHSRPVADFASVVTDEVTAAQFTDASTHPNAPVDAPPAGWTYAWNFAGEASSGAQNPSYTFLDGGAKAVTLTVTDNDGQTHSVQKTVQVAHVAPVADFSVAGTQETDTYVLTDTSTHPNAPTDGIASRSWSCSDGFAGSAPSVSHKFADGGSYTCTLTVTDNDGLSSSLTKTIGVAHVAPNAAFSNGAASELQAMAFTDGSTHPNAPTDAPPGGWSYAWAFGDGATSSDRSPSHDYADGGSYTVSLTATDNDGQASTATRTVSVTHVAPVASFTWSPENPDPGAAVTFQDLSSHPNAGVDSIVAWAWDFADGTTSAAQNPTHTFVEQGLYLVSLTVTDDDGLTHSVTLRVPIGNLPPVAAFSWSPTTPTDLEDVQFTDESTDADGEIVSWAWDFGDGSTSTARNPVHRFADNGFYTVSLTVTDSFGATTTLAQVVEVLNVGPSAGFAFGPNNPGVHDAVQFQDQSTDPDGSVVAWAWNFGDGVTSTAQNPVHAFAEGGDYTVTLTVTDDDGAQSTVTRTVHVCETGFDLAKLRLEVCLRVEL